MRKKNMKLSDRNTVDNKEHHFATDTIEKLCSELWLNLPAQQINMRAQCANGTLNEIVNLLDKTKKGE